MCTEMKVSKRGQFESIQTRLTWSGKQRNRQFAQMASTWQAVTGNRSITKESSVLMHWTNRGSSVEQKVDLSQNHKTLYIEKYKIKKEKNCTAIQRHSKRKENVTGTVSAQKKTTHAHRKYMHQRVYRHHKKGGTKLKRHGRVVLPKMECKQAKVRM